VLAQHQRVHPGISGLLAVRDEVHALHARARTHTSRRWTPHALCKLLTCTHSSGWAAACVQPTAAHCCCHRRHSPSAAPAC
jgi:hypothetical protein